LPGQQALSRSRAGERYQGSIGTWAVEVRPLRANQQDCLDCHATFAATDGIDKDALEIGDALGVVIYVYSRKPK